MKYIFDPQEEKDTQTIEEPTGLERSVGADSEITLGTRSLLGIFFGLVLICGIFFGLGYSVGRGSTARAALQTSTDATSASTASHPAKPSAEQGLNPVTPPLASQVQPATDAVTPASSASASTTDAAADPADDAPAPATKSSAPPPARTPAPSPASTPTRASAYAPSSPSTAEPAATRSAAPPPAPRHTALVAQAPPAPAPVVSNSGPIMVQIAAISVAQDANILVSALQKRGFNAVIRNEPQDKLLHVQVGPFASRADAYNMRSKLLADGYNAVVK